MQYLYMALGLLAIVLITGIVAGAIHLTFASPAKLNEKVKKVGEA